MSELLEEEEDLDSLRILDDLEANIQENLEDPLVQEALEKGIDVRQYSRTIENELADVEQASVRDYIQESKNIASLHQQIKACDCTLETMEAMLQGFQMDLGNISSEIQTLQKQSIEMNIKLKNRQAVRGELSQYIDEMVVPEGMINHILDTPVTDREFVEQLHELNHKINFAKEQSFKDSKSVHDVENILEKLKYRATAKIREFCLLKIQQFKKPMANYQIPQNALLKHRFFFEFLMSHERQVAREIREEYNETMSRVYYSYFKAYNSKLMKLQMEKSAEKGDLLGADDGQRRGFFSASRPSTKARSSTFTIGQRGDVLAADLEAPAILPHASAKVETKFTYEQLFRSMQYALVDNSCREYLFLCDFFMVSAQSAQAQFNMVMGKTLSMCMTDVDGQAKENHDVLALFLCIHLIFRYRSLMNKRGVPALDKYWETILEIFWPRFESTLHAHLHSLSHCDPHKLGQVDTKPHYITRRYAELNAALTALNESFPEAKEERVGPLLGALRAEFETFLLKMAAEFTERKHQLVFFINNYDMIAGILGEITSPDCQEVEAVNRVLTQRSNEYILEVLSPYFGGLINFVRDAEAALEKHATDRFHSKEKVVGQMVRSFNNDWKQAIDIMNTDVMKSFTNFKNGMQILQGALTQLIQIYHRFQKVMGQPPFKNWPITKELLNIHHLMVEVKKHKLTF